MTISKKAEFTSGKASAAPQASSGRHGWGPFSSPMLPDLGTLSYFLQEGHSLGQEKPAELPPKATRRDHAPTYKLL